MSGMRGCYLKKLQIQIEEPYSVEKPQRKRGPIQRNEKIHSQVRAAEATKKIQGEYLQLHFIPSLQSKRIPVFEASLRISNVAVQIYQQLPHLDLPIGEGPKSSYISALSDTGARLNYGNIKYHQSVPERQLNLVLKFEYLKDIEDVDPLNTCGVDGGK